MVEFGEKPSREHLPASSLERGVNFVDETASTMTAYRQYNDDGDGDSESAQVTESASNVPFEVSVSASIAFSNTPSQIPDLSPTAITAFNNPPSIIGLPLAANIQYDLNHSGTWTQPTPSQLAVSSPQYGRNQADRGARSTSALPSQFSPYCSETTGLSHPREAYLIKFFTQTWGPIFDSVDAEWTFTRSVVQMALTSSQPLFWAILATSALQLSRVSDYPFAAAQHYRSRCSKAIMPVLSVDPEAREEMLFATYVMLRNYDHMTSNLLEKNSESLFTASLAISANPSEVMDHKADLGRAAFWVHVRQDIHIALLLGIPINVDYPLCIQKDRILSNLDLITTQQIPVRQDVLDCAWTNKLAILLVEIINYSFGKERQLQSWITLRGRLDHWTMAKPTSFTPYFERSRALSEGRPFPEVWLTSDCQVIAWLYFHTATILLKTYPPNNQGLDLVYPVLGSLANREEVLLHARAICGIVATNPNAQALIVMCHMAIISARFFTDIDEQNEVISLLKTAHTVTGHPYEHIEAKLHEYWNGCG